jgi:hypothetical protein
LVNIVCDGALLAGYGRGSTSIGADVIREVADDLYLSGERGEFEAAESSAPAPKRRGWLKRLARR